MENLKNIIMDSDFISLLIINGIIFAIVSMIVDRYKTKVKFYQTVLGGNYEELLRFLMITNTSKQKRICYPWYIDYIKRGLRTYFDSRLNVIVTSSRITRIQDFMDRAKNEVKNTAPHLEHESSYWAPIISGLKEVISYCGPHYFASCYVASLADKENDENYARMFLLDFYNECANSRDEQIKKQFSTFVDLVNEEINKYQAHSVAQEKKDFVMRNKLSVKSSATTLTKVWATTNF